MCQKTEVSVQQQTIIKGSPNAVQDVQQHAGQVQGWNFKVDLSVGLPNPVSTLGAVVLSIASVSPSFLACHYTPKLPL